jgi:hypothetical protein
MSAQSNPPVQLAVGIVFLFVVAWILAIAYHLGQIPLKLRRVFSQQATST